MVLVAHFHVYSEVFKQEVDDKQVLGYIEMSI